MIAKADYIYNEGFSTGIKPDPYLDLVEWSNTYRELPRESSREPGKYRTSRTPWVEEILWELSPQSPTQEVVVMKPTQMGFTEVANNFLFAIAHLYPGPCMFVQPTVEMVTKHSKKKITPSLREMDCLKGVIKEPRSRESGNTLLLKEFPGGSWTFTGSNSPVAARGDSIRYLVLDDYDGFEMNIGGEGDPGDLFKKRTDAFGSRRKTYMNSTPTIKGASHIEREYIESSQGRYYVPCPFCDMLQYLQWGGKDCKHGIKFVRRDIEIRDIWYICQFCFSRIDEYHKTNMLIGGKYVHKFPERKKRGFMVNSLYSPLGWLSWAKIAEEFIKAKTPEKLQVWSNTRMSETFEAQGDQPDWAILKARCEPYKILTVPAGGLLLSAGVDVQDNRLAVVIIAWGIGEEAWIIYWGEIYGDPSQPEVWAELDSLLTRPYPHVYGVDLYIVSTAVDTQGHHTQEVYNYCRQRAPHVIAIQGASQSGKPIVGRPTLQDVTYRGAKIKNGVQLWPIGTDTAKSTIYSRLKLITPGPGYYHFPIGLSDEFFEQLTAEKHVTRYNKQGVPVQEWVRTRRRNEALDCCVYAYGAALRYGLARVDWQGLKDSIATAPQVPSSLDTVNQSQPYQSNRSYRNTQTYQQSHTAPAGVARSRWMSR